MQSLPWRKNVYPEIKQEKLAEQKIWTILFMQTYIL